MSKVLVFEGCSLSRALAFKLDFKDTRVLHLLKIRKSEVSFFLQMLGGMNMIFTINTKKS